jgi:4-carboxymuconolactone decarboxylase
MTQPVRVRLAPIDPPFDDAVAEDLRALMPPGMAPIALFRTLAHNPRVLRRVRRGGLLDPGSISLREREIVILRTTARCGSEYEWGVHVAFFAAAAGLSAETIAATVLAPDGADPSFGTRDRLLVTVCDELHAGARLSEPTYAALADAFTPAQIVEILALAGQYHLISFVTNATGVPLEPGAAHFPARPL